MALNVPNQAPCSQPRTLEAIVLVLVCVFFLYHQWNSSGLQLISLAIFTLMLLGCFHDIRQSRLQRDGIILSGCVAVPMLITTSFKYGRCKEVYVFLALLNGFNFVTSSISFKLMMGFWLFILYLSTSLSINVLDIETLIVGITFDLILRSLFGSVHIARTLSLVEASIVSQGMSLLSAFTFRLSFGLTDAHAEKLADVWKFIALTSQGACVLWICLLAVNVVMLRANLSRRIQTTVLWSGIAVGGLGILVLLMMVLKQNPLLWLFEYILFQETNRTGILMAWTVSISCFLFYLAPNASTSLNQTTTRKLFHGIAVITFPPVALYDPAFLSLSFTIAIVLLLLLELCRVTGTGQGLHPIGPLLQPFYARFTDEREDDGHGPALVLTPIYLLVGCALPHWLATPQISVKDQLLGFTGILMLGIGDSFAAIVGSKYGITKWPHCMANRSVEGSVAAMLSMVIGILIFNKVCERVLPEGEGGLESSELLLRTWFPLILCTLVEAYTTALDNLVLPIYGTTLLALVLLET